VAGARRSGDAHTELCQSGGFRDSASSHSHLTPLDVCTYRRCTWYKICNLAPLDRVHITSLHVV
jgi:hypothetical protein